ncbi:MAG: hypothetical protein ACPL2D_04535 [Ignavibacteria bacterium]
MIKDIREKSGSGIEYIVLQNNKEKIAASKLLSLKNKGNIFIVDGN